MNYFNVNFDLDLKICFAWSCYEILRFWKIKIICYHFWIFLVELTSLFDVQSLFAIRLPHNQNEIMHWWAQTRWKRVCYLTGIFMLILIVSSSFDVVSILYCHVPTIVQLKIIFLTNLIHNSMIVAEIITNHSSIL